MRQELTSLLTSLQDGTGSLGVGVADANGLLIQSQGEHGGIDAGKIAAHLAARRGTSLEQLVGDPVEEHITVGRTFTFVVRWFLDHGYFIYAMTHREIRGGPVRHGIKTTAERLERWFDGRGLLLTKRERLEEPRKFSRDRLIR